MPLSATVTPLSLYMLDNTVFDGLQLPTMPQNPTDYPDLYVEGFALDREVLVNNILMETGELDCIYPDPDFFKFAVTQWSKKELHVWQELYNTIFYKYNPLWNKDGTIKETARELRDLERGESRSRTVTGSEDISDTTSDSEEGELSRVTSDTILNTGTVQDAGTNSKNTTHGGNVTTTGSNSSEVKVAAYNDPNYSNRDQTTGSNSQTVTDASTIAETGSDGNTRTNNLREESDGSVTDETSSSRSGTYSRDRDTEETESETVSATDEGSIDHSLTRTEQGNIGVTMTSQLIAAQRELVQFNFYDLIVERFKERFCLLVY